MCERENERQRKREVRHTAKGRECEGGRAHCDIAAARRTYQCHTASDEGVCVSEREEENEKERERERERRVGHIARGRENGVGGTYCDIAAVRRTAAH